MNLKLEKCHYKRKNKIPCTSVKYHLVMERLIFDYWLEGAPEIFEHKWFSLLKCI